MTHEGKYDVVGLNKLATQSYSSIPDKLTKAHQVVEICAEEGWLVHFVLYIKVVSRVL